MIDINKKYKTKDGKGVRIYSVSGGGEYPVHGSVKQESGFWSGFWWCTGWTDTGSLLKSTTSPADLVEVKPTRWINVYEHYTVIHPSKEEADEMALNDIRIACVEFKKGDGL